MKKDYIDLSNAILDRIGGKNNVTHFTHCITRLRFHVKNKDQVKIEELKDLKGTLGAQWSGDQLQIIIGAEVDDVYDAICAESGLGKSAEEPVSGEVSAESGKKKKWSLNMLFETLSGCMVPVLPALCAAGIVKGILVMLTTYCGMPTESGIYVLLNTVGDIAFYFMPFLVAYSASRKFNTNACVALLVAGIYMHPNINNLANTNLNVLGINLHILNYASTIFPMLISVWLLSYLYRFIDKYVPKALRFVLTPSLSLLIMTPVCLGIVGPIGYYIGYYLATFVSNLFYVNPYIGGLVLGIIRPFVLLTGMQTTFTPIIINNLTTLGYDFIWPVHSVFSMCCCGLSIGAFIKAKRVKGKIGEEKENFFSSFISGFAGVSEPALYGNAFRFKGQLLALVISSGVCGALTSGLGCKAIAGANPPWLFLPSFGDTAGLMAVMFAAAFLLAAVMSYLFGFDSLPIWKKGEK